MGLVPETSEQACTEAVSLQLLPFPCSTMLSATVTVPDQDLWSVCYFGVVSTLFWMVVMSKQSSGQPDP